MRSISHSEASKLLDCQFAHAFRYTGTLTGGDALEPRAAIGGKRLEGSIWGRAVAELHATGNLLSARVALNLAFDDSVDTQMAEKLYAILEDYFGSADRIPLVSPEYELTVPIPGKPGYEFQGFLDGVHLDDEGRAWLVEFKLRSSLTPLPILELDRQCRWYAWAWREQTGTAPAGVIIDERLNAVPEPVRFNQDGKPSKTQSCSPSAYAFECVSHEIEPDGGTMARLNRKRWQQRHRMSFTPYELDEVDAQLRTVAAMVKLFDRGRLYPVRNPNRNRCLGCDFRDICPDPTDVDLIDSLYERVPAKRNRIEVPSA